MLATAVMVTNLPAHSQEPDIRSAREREDYIHVPMPPGFRVEPTETEGMVFADSRGRTLYKWPLLELRRGYAGDPVGKSACDDVRQTKSAGLAGGYRPGLIMPEVNTRPSCSDLWPPVLASDDDKPVGAWTIIIRKGGARQWAFDGHALYLSIFDHKPGDVNGGTAHNSDTAESPAVREPVGPPPNIPPGFAVVSTVNGRLLMTDKHMSVYSSAKDGANRSNCNTSCAETWQPVLAPELAHPRGGWSVFERSPGVKQWAYRGKPLYTHVFDTMPGSVVGSDVPGWSNTYTTHASPPPSAFKVQNTDSGQVLADPHGKTIYLFKCTDDAQDQLACDHPETTQVYRLAMCGAGNVQKCLTTFPYVEASSDAKSSNPNWSVIEIDPTTGHRAVPGQSEMLRVWAYRDRPVYTYSGDHQPGDARGDSRGEFSADRFGFKAFWVRDDFFMIVAR